MAFIYFIYGLGFFSLGLSILVYPKRESEFGLARTIVFIGIFGILHGIHEWYDMLSILWSPPHEIQFLLKLADRAIVSASFLSLIIFGVKTLDLNRQYHPALKKLPYLLYIIWITVVSITDLNMGVTWARYILAVPGIFLSACALYSQSHKFMDDGMSYTAVMLGVSSFMFILYGVLAGIIVSPAQFFPASAINSRIFFDVVGVPVEMFRTVCSLSIAFTMISVLKVFEFETSARIRRYTKELEEANRIKGLFGDIMSHDLSNSIHNISFASDILLETINKENNVVELVGTIQSSANNMNSMIRSAALLSKLETIKKLEFKEEDVAAIIRGIIADFRTRAEENGQRLVFHSGREFPADVHFTIRDVFMNLVSNAIKYSSKGGSIDIGIEEDSDDHIVVYVKDCGSGVPDKYKEQIFERFERGGKEGVKGVGLGLAITRRILDLHNGRVWVEDNPQGGSIFKVLLPKKRDIVISHMERINTGIKIDRHTLH